MCLSPITISFLVKGLLGSISENQGEPPSCTNVSPSDISVQNNPILRLICGLKAKRCPEEYLGLGAKFWIRTLKRRGCAMAKSHARLTSASLKRSCNISLMRFLGYHRSGKSSELRSLWTRVIVSPSSSLPGFANSLELSLLD